MVGISGTEKTLYPLSDIYCLILASEVVLPAHGPPVITIL